MSKNIAELFEESKSLGPIKYKENSLYLIDEIPIINNDSFQIIIESIKQKKKIQQGIFVNLKNTKNGQIFIGSEKKGCPGLIYIHEKKKTVQSIHFIYKGKKPNILQIKNCWKEDHSELGYTTTKISGGGSSSMTIESLQNKSKSRRYRCNDGVSDDLKSIIFRIEQVADRN